MFRKRPKSAAIFVDHDNVGQVELRNAIPAWLAWLEDGAFPKAEGQRVFLQKRAYWNGRNDVLRPIFEAAGFEAFACRSFSSAKQQKSISGVDLRLTIDAVDAAHALKRLDEVFVFSTDTDYVPLVRHLRGLGKTVIALADERNATAAIYREEADVVITTRALLEACAYQRATPSPRGRLLAPAPAAAPAEPTLTGADPIDAVADAVVEAAKAKPGVAIGRRTIQSVANALPGFSLAGPGRWFGQENYDGLMRAILERKHDVLAVRTEMNGGRSVYYPAAPAEETPAAGG